MKTKRQVKKLFLVAFVVSGLAFVPMQRSDAQIEIGIPGIWPKPGGNYGYPHFEYGIYPYGLYYRQPDYYGGLVRTRKRFPATTIVGGATPMLER